MYEYKAVCTKVIDGDTIELVVDLGFNISHTIRGRLYNVFAPEVFSGNNREAGLKAKEFVEQTVLGHTVIVNTYKDKMTFNRWVVEIKTSTGVNLNEMIDQFCKTLI